MLLNKRLKAFPICNFMPTPLLIVRDRSTVSGLLFALEPQVESIATDVEYLADIGFAFAANDAQQSPCGAGRYCRGQASGFFNALYLSIIRPNTA